MLYPGPPHPWNPELDEYQSLDFGIWIVVTRSLIFALSHPLLNQKMFCMGLPHLVRDFSVAFDRWSAVGDTIAIDIHIRT